MFSYVYAHKPIYLILIEVKIDKILSFKDHKPLYMNTTFDWHNKKK